MDDEVTFNTLGRLAAIERALGILATTSSSDCRQALLNSLERVDDIPLNSILRGTPLEGSSHLPDALHGGYVTTLTRILHGDRPLS